jgi:hypothetical protein
MKAIYNSPYNWFLGGFDKFISAHLLRHAIKGNHRQITFKIITNFIKPHLHDNLNMIIAHTKGLVK